MDERLEALSDKVRRGIPIDFGEALEVIDYQKRLQAEREERRSKTLLGRVMRWVLPDSPAKDTQS